jgi:hypothetical protein
LYKRQEQVLLLLKLLDNISPKIWLPHSQKNSWK